MKNDSRKIYLDYSATTPMDPEVVGAVERTFKNTFGNASSVHSFGRSAKIALEESRETIARSIGAEPAEIFFTSGGTESDNHALFGTALAERFSRNRSHIIISSIEHHAVIDSAEYLKRLGFRVSEVPVNPHGEIVLEALEKLITAETFLISVMHANNETGVIQPIRQIAELAKGRNIILHSDAVQTLGKIPLDVNSLMVDILSLSAHKIYGPKGIGAVFIRKGTLIDAFLHGGSQERNNRAGTENIPLIAGFSKAVSVMENYRDKTYRNAMFLKTKFLNTVSANLEGIVVNGDPSNSLPHILNLSLGSEYYNIEGETLLLAMDLRGIAVSSGSACTSGSIQPSHVLTAMGRDDRTTRATVRFSFGRMTEESEVDAAIQIFSDIALQCRK